MIHDKITEIDGIPLNEVGQEFVDLTRANDEVFGDTGFPSDAIGMVRRMRQFRD